MSHVRLAATIEGASEDLDVLVGALGPEQEAEVPGVEASLTRAGPDRLELTIAGPAPAPVRAATNAYLRWVRTVESVLTAATPPEDAP